MNIQATESRDTTLDRLFSDVAEGDTIGIAAITSSLPSAAVGVATLAKIQAPRLPFWRRSVIDDVDDSTVVPRFWHRFRSSLSIAALIGLWQLAVTVLHPNSLAIVGPWQVALEARYLWQNGVLANDLRVSGEEFGIGFGLALIAGVSLGVLLGLNKRLSSFFDPWVTIFYTVPVIAVAPMIIIGLGITMTAKVVIVGSATLFPILLNTQAGVRNLDGGLRDVAVAFRASKVETLRFVILPGSIPYILTGVRLGVGRGLISLVAGDLFGATSGLGYLILSGEQNLNTAGVYVGVVLLSVIGLTLTRLAGLAERHFATYRADGSR